MQRIVINIQSNVYAEAVQMALREHGDFHVIVAERPEETARLAVSGAITALLMEVTPYTPYKLAERLAIIKTVREKNPQCKIALLVDEKAHEDLAEKAQQAKRDGIIDQFVYTSISMSYLAGIMGAL